MNQAKILFVKNLSVLFAASGPPIQQTPMKDWITATHDAYKADPNAGWTKADEDAYLAAGGGAASVQQ